MYGQPVSLGNFRFNVNSCVSIVSEKTTTRAIANILINSSFFDRQMSISRSFTGCLDREQPDQNNKPLVASRRAMPVSTAALTKGS
jgi:hypothetical protein